ncbi:MAG TPA: response regulator [Terriglobales bacterium]|nr:response regulator [Terriglobales bacterium]
MKVLVADRDAMSRHIIVQTVANTSLEICCVADGAEAWERLNVEQPPRLLILDCLLPKLSGLEICRTIRERGSPDYTYIIALSERTSRSDKLAALDAGADDYITKPVHQYELLAKVRIARRFLGKEDRLTAIVHGWRTMLDNLPFGVACLSRNGNVLRTNKVFANLLHHDIKDMIGKNLIPTAVRRAGDLTKLRESMRQSQAFDAIEMEFIRADGTSRLALVWGRPVSGISDVTFQIVTAEA